MRSQSVVPCGSRCLRTHNRGPCETRRLRGGQHHLRLGHLRQGQRQLPRPVAADSTAVRSGVGGPQLRRQRRHPSSQGRQALHSGDRLRGRFGVQPGYRHHQAGDERFQAAELAVQGRFRHRLRQHDRCVPGVAEPAAGLGLQARAGVRRELRHPPGGDSR